MGAVGRVIYDHVAEDHAAKRPKDETDGGAAHEVRLQQVARLMQLAEIGAAPRQAMHVSVLNACKEEVVRGARRARDVGEEKVEPSLHGPPPTREPIRLRLAR